MERKIVFNYDALDNYLKEQQKNPNRTNWELTMLRDNCRKYLIETAEDLKELIISINESTRDVTINGEIGLENKFDTLPTWYEMDRKAKLYRQIKLSMEEAEKLGIFGEIFKDTRKELDSLRKEINNSNQ